MISHGNLIDSLLQVIVMSAEALKVQPVCISLLSVCHFLIWVLQKPTVWNGPAGRNVTFNVLPIHHVYGLHITTFRSFFTPTTLVLLPKWNADVYFDSIPKYVSLFKHFYLTLTTSPPSRYRVTSIFLVPSLVHQIVHHPRFPTTDFRTVQTINCGAAYLPVSLAEQLRSRFPSVERVGEGE